jgi:HEPN domain-containing protein
MNRSRSELKKLQSRLSSGTKPELYKLLLLNAKASLKNKDYTLAIVESFQALEIFIENYRIAELKKKGKTESEYKKILDKNLRTKDRLNKVLEDLKGASLNQKTELWDPWCTRYGKTRNEVVHLGKEPTEIETSDTLTINEGVIDWILSL